MSQTSPRRGESIAFSHDVVGYTTKYKRPRAERTITPLRVCIYTIGKESDLLGRAIGTRSRFDITTAVHALRTC